MKGVKIVWRYLYKIMKGLVDTVVGSGPFSSNGPFFPTAGFLALTTSAIPTSLSPPWTAFTEPTFPGYTRPTFGAWLDGVDDEGNPYAVAGSVAWTNAGTFPITVTGVVAIDMASGDPDSIWAIFIPPSPVTIPVGGILTFVPNYPEGGQLVG